MPDPALLSNTIIGIQRETVRGTAPTTGVYNAVPFLDGISLSYESTPTEFDVYDGTRMKSFTVGGSRAVRLRIPTVLNYEQGQQDLLRAWLHAAAWAGGAIVADADPGYFFTIIAKMELSPQVMTISSSLAAKWHQPRWICHSMTRCQSTMTSLGLRRLLAARCLAQPRWARSQASRHSRPASLARQSRGMRCQCLAHSRHRSRSTIRLTRSMRGAAQAQITSSTRICESAARLRSTTAMMRSSLMRLRARLRHLPLSSSQAKAAAEDTFTVNIPKALAVNAPVSDSAGSMASAVDFRAQYDTGISSLIGMTVA